MYVGERTRARKEKMKFGLKLVARGERITVVDTILRTVRNVKRIMD